MESVHNRVPSQPSEALGVSGPISGRVGGDTPIVVEIYALGRGVTLVGQRSNLLARQGTFELEAHGKVFVFDELGAIKANRLVATVKGHIAAIWHPLEAVDQKQVAELGFSSGHSQSPLKTAILSLPQGMGKTTIGGALAQRLGCTRVVDEWWANMPITPGALHLTCQDLPAEVMQ